MVTPVTDVTHFETLLEGWDICVCNSFRVIYAPRIRLLLYFFSILDCDKTLHGEVKNIIIS